jgi:undecaprenyl-diphosphatase
LGWEKHLEHWIVEQRVGWLDWLFIALSWIGRLGAVWIAIAFVLALMWRRPAILFMTVAAAFAGEFLADLGKAIVPRHRPFEHQLGPPSTTHSFPSGHSTTSFACATVLAHYAPRLRIPFFALAALIAFSRVYDGMHYPTDVLTGAVLGVLVGIGLVYAARRWGERVSAAAATALPLRGADRRRSRRAPRRH